MLLAFYTLDERYEVYDCYFSVMFMLTFSPLEVDDVGTEICVF